jgi:hypothetical protein
VWLRCVDSLLANLAGSAPDLTGHASRYKIRRAFSVLYSFYYAMCVRLYRLIALVALMLLLETFRGPGEAVDGLDGGARRAGPYATIASVI